MRLNRMLLSATLVVAALIVQVSVLARLQLPGATPDLLLLVVLGLALVYGHLSGAVIGFAAGLLADLAPPADHAIGRYALVLCVVGYAAGLVRPESGRHRSASVPMLVVASGAVGSTLLYAGVGALVGDGAAGQVGLGSLLLTATLYDLLLAPFTVPLVMTLARRTTHDPVAQSSAAAANTDTSAYRWLSSGTGMRLGRWVRPARGGLTPRIGGRRGLRLGRTPRKRVTRIKGVKRL